MRRENGRRIDLNGVIKYAVFISLGLLIIHKVACLSAFSKQIRNDYVGHATVDSRDTTYVPALTEQYLLDHSLELGYHVNISNFTTHTCSIWRNKSLTPIFNDLRAYLRGLSKYERRVASFPGSADIRLRMDTERHEDICQSLELGLKEIFSSQRQLSWSAAGGYIEPLLLPLRHPKFCLPRQKQRFLMDLGYLIHNFSYICRKIKRTSRFILVDMGASLEFHARRNSSSMPAIYLTELYHKFGFPFDHIYAFEKRVIPPERVFAKVPPELFASYHWINVGVEKDPESQLNPLNMLLDNFNKDDFIVVKLDIDRAQIELPLAMQLLTDDRYSGLVDQFYFEHHVKLRELSGNWGPNARGSVYDSLQLFTGLRKKGIAAHSWV